MRFVCATTAKMHRFVVDKPLCEGAEINLSPQESHHAAHVLRLKCGDTVQLLDGTVLWQAEIAELTESKVSVRVNAKATQPGKPCMCELWQGLPKSDKLELIVQKATELGADRIVPIEMERSVAQIVPQKEEKKCERLSRIALEAAKQSGRADVPKVECTRTLNEVLAAYQPEEGDLLLVAWEEEHTLLLSRAVAQMACPKRVILVIGPEGGISEREWLKLREKGAAAVSLGRRILRTETAGLCALSVLWAMLGEM